jgi:hypothetical protein
MTFSRESLVTLLAGTLCLHLSAQSPQSIASYADLVDRVNKGDLSIDFRALRFACLKAKNCDPEGDREDIVKLRRAMQSKDVSEAVKIGNKLIDHGFPNIEAHAFCSQAHDALNGPEKAKFHHEVTGSLIRSILASGDGKTEEKAFEVISVSEEYIIMQVLGLPRFPVQQSLVAAKGHSYDVLQVTDPKSGEKVSVYFNIDAFYPSREFAK